MRKKLLIVLALLCMTLPLTACTQDDVNGGNDKLSSVGDAASDNTKEEQEYQFDIVPYDETYREMDEWIGMSFSMNIISFPSTKPISEKSIEKIEGQEQFQSVLDEYDDIRDTSQDTLTITDDSFHYQHGAYPYSSVGIKKNFLLVKSPDLDPLSRMDVDEIRYDEETRTVYVLMEENNTHSAYEFDEEIKQNIDANSKATYCIAYYHADETRADKFDTVKFVLPENN